MASSFIRILISWIIIVACTSVLSGRQVNTVSTSVNAVASLDTNPQASEISLPGGNLFFGYGVYPSITLSSTGPRSVASFTYSFGFDRAQSSTALDSESHAFGVEARTQLTRRLELKLSESLTRAADFATFDLSRGILFLPEGVFFNSGTIGFRQKRWENTASIGFEYAMNPQSNLSIAFGHSLRKFQQNLLSLTQQLSDQTGFNASMGYTRTMGVRTQWKLGYDISRYDFQDFESGTTHNARMDFSYQMSPSASLSFGIGPSYTSSDRQSGVFSYRNGSLKFSKTLEDSLLRLSYSRQSGTSTGVGSLSDAQVIDFDFRRSLGRRIGVSSRLSLYDTAGIQDNLIDIRGLRVSVLFDLLLPDNWVLVFGASFQPQEGTAPYDFLRKRVFISLRFAVPQLLRF